MTARTARLLNSLALAAALAGCTTFYEIPIETPIQPKLDVTAFQRVLVAGFVAGGTEDVDANLETVRLLRSQLRSKSPLKVIDADVLPLMDMASDTQAEPAAKDSEGVETRETSEASGATEAASKPAEPMANGKSPQGDATLRNVIKEEKDLEPYEHLFADVSFWKKVGEEYNGPLIVTGTVVFLPHSRSGFVQREQEVYDSFGRRRVVPTRTYMERKGFILKPKFVFIDGRTGTTMYTETFREEVLYNPNQSTPALSSFFELMDRLIPSFLSTLSSQKVRGTRVLLK